MKMPTRILICGNYGATNIGDEAILQSILQYVRAVFPHAHLQVVSSNPALTAKQYQVETVEQMPAGFRSILKSLFSRRMRKTFHAYKHADVVLFGGGGLFTDEKPRAILIWAMQILPALWYKKNVMCFGQSIGPLFMRGSRWIVRKIFKKMKVITVRDEASRRLLNNMDIENVHVLPDPVFGLYTTCLRRHSRNHYVVFSLRPWIKEAEKIHGMLAAFIDWIYETYHLRTYMVPFQSVHDDDEKELLKLFSRLSHRDAAQVLAHNENICDTLKLMEGATAVVGMRLHSIIFSAVTHTPFVGLSYSLKVAEVVNQLGMKDYFCEYRFLDLNELKKKFEAVFTHRAHLEKELAEKHSRFALEAEGYKELLRKLVS